MEDSGNEIAVVSTGTMAPKEFKFVPVTEEWMRDRCKQLQLQFKGSRRKCGGDKKMALDSPPSNTEAIRGDGNCLFRTISHVVCNSQDHHIKIRNLVCDQIEGDPRRYVECGTGTKYIIDKKMRMARTYGTDIEIQAAADLLQTPIWVYGPQHDRHIWVEYKPKVSVSSESIFIVNRSEHFEPLYYW